MGPTRSRRSFSLVEVLVVVTLIAMLSATVGINIVKCIQERRFQEAVKVLKSKISNAHKLAKLSQGVVTVCIEQEGQRQKQGLVISLQGEAFTSEKTRRLLGLQERIPDHIILQLEGAQNSAVTLPLLLDFYPYGACYKHNESTQESGLQIITSSRNATSPTIPLTEIPGGNLVNESYALYPQL